MVVCAGFTNGFGKCFSWKQPFWRETANRSNHFDSLSGAIDPSTISIHVFSYVEKLHVYVKSTFIGEYRISKSKIILAKWNIVGIAI